MCVFQFLVVNDDLLRTGLLQPLWQEEIDDGEERDGEATEREDNAKHGAET
jgi:hypothetical protein